MNVRYLVIAAIVALALLSQRRESYSTGWVCKRGKSPVGKVNIWWGHTAKDATWACNAWNAKCGSGKCVAKKASGSSTNRSIGEWTKTNISYFGQDMKDDKGIGSTGVNLFKLGGLTFEGKRVYPVAVHHDHIPQYLYKVLEIRATKVTPGFLGVVLDTCDRTDGDCNVNRNKNGLGFLIDIHKTGFEASGNRNNGNDLTSGEFRVIGTMKPSQIPIGSWEKGADTDIMCRCTGRCDNDNNQTWVKARDASKC